MLVLVLVLVLEHYSFTVNIRMISVQFGFSSMVLFVGDG